MNLERAAQALVECGYGTKIDRNGYGDTLVISKTIQAGYENVDPLNNEAQLFALAHWFLFPDKTLILTGDGHFNVKEQLQNFVAKNLK